MLPVVVFWNINSKAHRNVLKNEIFVIYEI